MLEKYWEKDETWIFSWDYLFQPHIMGLGIMWIIGLYGSAAFISSTSGSTHTIVKSVKSIATRKSRPSLTPMQIIRQIIKGGVLSAWANFWRKFPHRMYSFYIEAFLIPLYRSEWGKYKTWNYRARDRPEKSFHLAEVLKARKRQEKLKLLHKSSIAIPTAHNHHECSRVRINVTGAIFETQLRTLNKFPDTLLGDPERRIKHYDPNNDWFYFDRNRNSFESILYFYQSGGRFRRPENIHMDVFLDDADFYQIPAAVVQTYRFDEGLSKDSVEADLPLKLFLRKIWLLFDFPESGSQARILAMISIFVVVVSIILFCIETLPDFATRSETTLINGVMVTQTVDGADMGDPFFFIETTCTAWFTVELTARLISCPNKVHFLTSILNLIDFMAVVPFFITFVSAKAPAGSDSKVENTAYLSILRVIRLVRVFRIFKLSRHSTGLKILGRTLKASLSELFLLIFFVFIGIIIFSSTMYFCELGESRTNFTSIPDGFWWAVITMTTVGYGDIVPITAGGKIVGSLCAVAGVLTIALPVPVIVSNFNYFYHQAMDEQEFNWTKINYVGYCPYRPGGFGPIDSNDQTGSEFNLGNSSDEFEELKYNPAKAKPNKATNNKK